MTANRATALRVVWGTRHLPVSEVRELLAMCGLIEPDGHEILPDITGGIRLPGVGRPVGNTDDSPAWTPDQDDDVLPPSKRLSTPPGLAALPLTAPVPTPRKLPAQAAPKVASTPPTTPAAPQRPRGRKPIPHGTLTGYTEHSKRKEPIPPDDPCGCRAAGSAYYRARAQKKKLAAAAIPAPTPTAMPVKRVSPALPPIEHGTPAGWQGHHDRGALPVCAPCAAAVAPPPPDPVKPLVQAPETAPEPAVADADAAEPEPARPSAGQDVRPWLAHAQRSRNRAVARAAAIAVGLLVRIEMAPVGALADGRLTARLAAALDDVTRAQARATPRTNGNT